MLVFGPFMCPNSGAHGITNGPSTGHWPGGRRTGILACSVVTVARTGTPSPTAWSVQHGLWPGTDWICLILRTWWLISSECCEDERTRRRRRGKGDERSDGPERDCIALESMIYPCALLFFFIICMIVPNIE